MSDIQWHLWVARKSAEALSVTPNEVDLKERREISEILKRESYRNIKDLEQPSTRVSQFSFLSTLADLPSES